jgi:phospholipid/cholesterol/gamma-HCH transport system substrate-binding protein
VSDYETIQRKRNIIVGIFVIVGLCALVWLIFKFGDLPTAVTKVGSIEVFVQFPTAPGVQRDTPVRFCGFQIGRVTAVTPPEIRTDMVTGMEYYQTVVVLAIDKRYVNIPSSIEVKLMTRGLGSSYIELKQCPGEPATPLDPNRPETIFLVDKIWLQGSTGTTSEFFPEESQKKLDELVENFKALLTNANDIIGGRENKENIKKTLANLAEASEQARQTIEEFQKFAVAGTSTLKNADVKTEKIVAAVLETSEELSKATSKLRLILEKIDSGQGTAARLINDGRFYENLLENTQQMQVLLEEFKSFIAQARDKGVPIKLK